MKEPVSKKDLLLTMLAELNEQLEEVDSIIETSFSELRSHWFREETQKLASCGYMVSQVENTLKLIPENIEDYSVLKKKTSALTLELGFH